MSEEQNDSPAFRLRPRRAAPKSYYTVRLEYSANPAAFIRERPRGTSKKKALSQKSGSNSTKSVSNSNLNAKPIVVSKEEREREERRMMLHRDIYQSITKNTLISPFMQRLRLGELEPNSVYEHNYITMPIVRVEESHSSGLLFCLCHSTLDEFEENSFRIINVHLYNEYANTSLVKPGKIINIAKFKTSGFVQPMEKCDDLLEMTSMLPFNIIVKCDELVERATNNSNRGSPTIPSTSPGGASVNRRPLIPFVSINDMIEEPTEPYVEMSNPDNSNTQPNSMSHY